MWVNESVVPSWEPSLDRKDAFLWNATCMAEGVRPLSILICIPAFACQAGHERASLDSDAQVCWKDELTPSEREEFAVQLSAVASPVHIRGASDAWQSADVEFDSPYRVQLDDAEIQDIIQLARRSGIAKPSRVRVMNLLGAGTKFRVVVESEPKLSADSRSMTVLTLVVSNAEWDALTGKGMPDSGVGPWFVDRDSDDPDWHFGERSSRCLAAGEMCWSYDASEDVPEELIWDLFLAGASGMLDWSTQERSGSAFEMGCRLGTILSRAEVKRRGYESTRDWFDKDWEYLLRVRLSPGAGGTFAVIMQDGVWQVVYSYVAVA